VILTVKKWKILNDQQESNKKKSWQV